MMDDCLNTYSFTASTYSEFGIDNALILTPIAVSMMNEKQIKWFHYRTNIQKCCIQLHKINKI